MKKDLEYEVTELIKIIDRLRSREGCPWDRCQKKKDVGKYLIDEAYEVIDAIDEGTPDDLKEELGDLLFQILFLAKISAEKGEFDMTDVVKGISEKMIRRHPHVFGDRIVNNAEEVKLTWQDIKRVERLGKKQKKTYNIGNMGNSLPSLLQAFKITDRASKVGFDWKNTEGVIEKLEEEIAELKSALSRDNPEQIEDEIGDIFFSLVNLSRFVKINPEIALRASINKFIKRFSFIENRLKEQGKTLPGVSLEEMDNLWNIYKENERKH